MIFLDLFAGIGGLRKGLELAGHKCIGFCEWDKYARASYISMHCATQEQRNYLSTLDLNKRQKEVVKHEYLNGEWCSTDIRTAEPEIFQKPIVGDSVHLVKTSLLVELEQDCKATEVVLSEKCSDFSMILKKNSDLNGLSMKTLKECLVATKDMTSSQFSLKWMNWGMIANGKLSTQKTMVSHNQEKGSILSDILEDAVPKEYFLSSQRMEQIAIK